MSASRIPTLNPIFDNVIAIFEVTVDFPTPPFPDAIAITFCMPFIGFPLIWFWGDSVFLTLKLILSSTFSMKFLKIISFIEFSMFFFDCNVGLLVSISNKISLPKIFRLIILKSFFLFFSIS